MESISFIPHIHFTGGLFYDFWIYVDGNYRYSIMITNPWCHNGALNKGGIVGQEKIKDIIDPGGFVNHLFKTKISHNFQEFLGKVEITGIWLQWHQFKSGRLKSPASQIWFPLALSILLREFLSWSISIHEFTQTNTHYVCSLRDTPYNFVLLPKKLVWKHSSKFTFSHWWRTK